MKSNTENPWSHVSDIEELHFYCCPECHVKDNSKKIFVQHALEQHPNSKTFFLKNLFNACDDEEIHEENLNNDDNCDIKEEITCDPLKLNNENFVEIDPEKYEIQKVTTLSFKKESNEGHNQGSDLNFDESTEDQNDFDHDQVDNPLQCPHCQKIFAHNSSLNKHLQKGRCDALKKNDTTCPHCMRNFAHKNSLQKHLKNVLKTLNTLALEQHPNVNQEILEKLKEDVQKDKEFYNDNDIENDNENDIENDNDNDISDDDITKQELVPKASPELKKCNYFQNYFKHSST